MTGRGETAEWAEILKAVALEVLGQPVERRGTEWRYGRHGSLVVNIGGQRAGPLESVDGVESKQAASHHESRCCIIGGADRRSKRSARDERS